MRGVVVAGTASGVGKTVATLAAIRALQRAGYAVQPAKAGPDFIDPSHHAAVAGRLSRTLDCWLEGDTGIRRNYYRGDGDICVVEGMMGLYDGDHSTAAVAAALSLPVVLVVDASAGMESVAATALGFREYADSVGRDIEVAGVLAARAHDGRHADGIEGALPGELSYFGRTPPHDGLEIPDRHLGLEMGDEAPVDGEALDRAADHVDAEALFDTAADPPRPEADDRTAPPRDYRVAVARDRAFRFLYPAVVERLRERTEVVTFAPTDGDPLPAADGVYLPGGYPELHADALAGSPALSDLRAVASDGLPVLGECGGMMTLCESLTTADGGRHDMAGVLPADVELCKRYQALDHVELHATESTLTADRSDRLRGHEFHYSRADVGADARFAFDVIGGEGIADGRDGLTEYRTLGTYAHVHAESTAFDAFIERL